MIQYPKKLIMLVVCCVITPCQSFAWSENGHRIVGKIAEKHLSIKSQKAIQQLLDNESLAEVSNWMDFIKSDHEWDFSNPYHYVNLEEGKGYWDSKKDPKGDIIRAIVFYEDVLRDKKSSINDKKIALKFIVHLIGDIHQPLHVCIKNDICSNKVVIKWFDEKTNLHRLWDENLIDFQKLSYTEYASFIGKRNRTLQKDWEKSSILDWLEESRLLSGKIYEGIKEEEGKNRYYLSYRYNYDNIAVLNERISKAGVRLAFFLNSIFDGRKNVDSDIIREKLGTEPNYGLPGGQK